MNRSRMLQGLLSRKPLLLDIYSGAVGAYSLRYLSSSFEGNDVILVRRSSDDAEQGFTPDEITDGTLTTFCGAGDGFVKTWYDQSGNVDNGAQTTAESQPKIVSSGSLISSNANPSLNFDGTDDFLVAGFQSVLSKLNSHSSFIVSLTNTINGVVLHSDLSSSDRFSIMYGSPDIRTGIYNGSNFISKSRGYSFDTQNLHSHFWTPSIMTAFLNNVEASGTETPFTGSRNRVVIGARAEGSTSNMSGTIQEIIVYPSDQSANRTEIEANINDHYNVF